MRRIDELISEYSESHTNSINKLIHAVAVPAIYFVSIGLVWSIPTPEFLDYFDITWAHVIAIPVLWYYFKLSGPIGAAMTLLTIASFLLVYALDNAGWVVWEVCLWVFILMWILQFVGHHIEGKKPSFFKDIQFLLVGPAWWWIHWLKRLHIDY